MFILLSCKSQTLVLCNKIIYDLLDQCSIYNHLTQRCYNSSVCVAVQHNAVFLF